MLQAPPTDDKGKVYFEELMRDIPEHRQKAVSMQMGIAVRMKSLMLEKGLSNKDLAEAMGIKPNVVSQWLTGLHNFSLATIAKISVALSEDILSIKLTNMDKVSTYVYYALQELEIPTTHPKVPELLPSLNALAEDCINKGLSKKGMVATLRVMANLLK